MDVNERADAVRELVSRTLRLDAEGGWTVTTSLSSLGLGSFDKLTLAVDLSERFGVPAAAFLPRHFATMATLLAAIDEVAEPRAASHVQLLQQSLDAEILAPPGSVVRHFVGRVNAAPNAPCLTDDDGSWTYAETWEVASGWANELARRCDAHPGHGRVVVLGDRGRNVFAAYLAVMLAGAAVVPLGAESPPARNRLIVEASGAAVAMSFHDAAKTREHCGDLEVFSPVETAPGSAPIGTRNRAASEEAYVIFTSGSTGTPKGVPISHANLNAFIEAAVQSIQPLCTDVFSQGHELSFDLSVAEFWLAWSAGAHIRICSRTAMMTLATTTRQQGITILTVTPSLLTFAAAHGQLAPGSMPHVREVMICGEALSGPVAEQVRRAAPFAVVNNCYGPTEATVWCSSLRLPPFVEVAADVVGRTPVCPLGTPHPGTDLSLLAEGVVQPPDARDVHGELLISSPQLFTGYIGFADPFHRANDRRWYRTGDRVRRDAEGVLHYEGRIDGQVKFHGFRIELGEVEAAVMRLLQRPAAAVVVGGDEPVLVVALTGEDPVPADLGESLARVLPPHMVPSAVLRIAEFPLTANGKLDRSQLAERVAESTYSRQQDESEKMGTDRGEL